MSWRRCRSAPIPRRSGCWPTSDISTADTRSDALKATNRFATDLATNRRWLGELDLPASTRQVIQVGLGQIDAARADQAPIGRWLARYAKA
jgi:hypothetical protein